METVINGRGNDITILVSSRAKSEIRQILDKNFENMSLPYKRWYALFNLCVYWYRCVLQSMSWVAEDSNVKLGKMYNSPIWSNDVEIGKFYC